MASSSQSSSSLDQLTLTKKYDVFVSFRGTDTRFNFTEHLFAALRRKGFVAFGDDTKFQKGESIAPELLRAIEASQVFIVVFSKDYASSTWCLQELESILHCVQVSGKRVLPVFYDIDPSEVRNQTGRYAEAFAKHEERFKQDLEMVCRWRKSLTQVANLSGFVLRDKPQDAVIEKIVEEIINILGYEFSSLPKDLVGIDSPTEELEKLLLLDSVDDVRVVGIYGMEGIGKTTLATVLYDRIARQFDACCFINNVSKIYGWNDGPDGVQKQILHQTPGEEHLQICSPNNATNLIQSRPLYARALIIIDNVYEAEQLEKLAMNRKWLAAGSRIIIISRDEHILKEYEVDVVYRVPLMNLTNSLQLFSRKAFKLDNIMSDYEELAYHILNYANGLPLAIKVLGSFLFGRDTFEWRSALARLRESTNKGIMDVLQLSFDGLDKMEQEIFLHIACFFNGHEEKFVKNVLNCCGFHPDIGLRVLIDKSLISISGESKIEMHGLLKELGRKIVQENSTKEPRKWSRLWLPKYVYNVMSENMEKNVEAVVLNGSGREKEILMAEALSKMNHLKLLILKKVKISGSLNCLSNELRYVAWDGFPFLHLPSSFQPTQLVELNMVHSNIEQLWKGTQCLPKLRTLDLSHSENLVKLPAFVEVPNLERLNLEGCVELVQMDPSINLLTKLVFLNLKNCKKLVCIPSSITVLSSLEYLNLHGCSNMFNKKRDASESALLSQSMDPAPRAQEDLASCLSNELRYVALDGYPFMYLPSNFQPNQLVELILLDSSIKQLWKGKKYLPYLRTLDLRYSENLIKVPDFVEIPNLERLNLEGCVKLVQIDPSIGLLTKLVFLNLKNCKSLACIPNDICGLNTLTHLNLCGCSKAFNKKLEVSESALHSQSTDPIFRAHEDLASCLLPSLPSFSCLSELDLSFCGLSEIPDAIGCLCWLERLNLRGNNLVTLPSLRELSKLEYLNLEHCKKLKSLTELPSPAAIKQGKHCRVGLYIFNCPELGERECCSSKTFSWMMQFIKANQESFDSFHQIDIVTPGSEMPRWFSNRRIGRSISIDPYSIMYDNNIVGIACCVVFSVAPYDPTTTRYEWGPVIRLGFSSSNTGNSHYAVIPVVFYRDLITVKSDHMWLIYFTRESFFGFLSFVDNTIWDLDHIKMEASVMNGQGLHLEVKNCGYRWVFET